MAGALFRLLAIFLKFGTNSPAGENKNFKIETQHTAYFINVSKAPDYERFVFA